MINKDELRILNNFICMMPKSYRKRTQNWVVVRDILLTNTATQGSTSCWLKCRELGINPDGYDFETEEGE